jgi:hypothetical protein
VPPAPAPVASPPTPAANDPAGIGAALARLGGGSRKNARAAATATALLMDEGEYAECAVQGQLYGSNAIVLLTNKRLLIVNDREFRPDVVEFTVDAAITVQGWADDRTAALLITRNDLSAQVDRIADKPLAQELAQRIRGRAAS